MTLLPAPLRSILRAVWIVVILAALLPFSPAAAQDETSPALVIRLDGALTPVMRQYLQRALDEAADRHASLLILELNTPGGSVEIMNQLVQDIRASQTPVVVYVSPAGAMAASAGTLITLAGHAAAMAPETTIGAASPVGGGGEDLGETMAAKEKNALKATVRTLASQRGEEAIHLAEAAIDNAEAYSAEEALQAGLVDFIAHDVNDLLRQLDGFKLLTMEGQPVLQTEFTQVQNLDMSLLERVLAALTNPNILVLLINIGAAAVLIEISTPGGWVAGTIGVICLALAAYGLGVLPVNWFGVVFLLLAFVLFILDIKAPTHGALTAAGVGSLIAGLLILFNPVRTPSIEPVSIPLVVTSSLITGGMFFLFLIFAVRAQYAPIRTGQEAIVGRTGTVIVPLSPRGQVRVGGETWSADLVDDGEPLPKGARVEVVAVQGLRVQVRRVS